MKMVSEILDDNATLIQLTAQEYFIVTLHIYFKLITMK
jgi:hypothetical protein